MTEERIIADVARRLNLSATAVKAVAELLDEGATVPFISRYRKERTGSLDEVAIRDIESMLKSVGELFARKDFVGEAIEAAGAMTDRLRSQLDEASTMTEVEDIYAPFKPKKRTRATIAREKGLEPLAKIIMAGNTSDCVSSASRFTGKNGVANEEEALAGACDIIAEWASESTRLRNITRNVYKRTATLECTVAKGKEEELKSSAMAQYAGFSRPVKRMASHQYLALRRAEKEGLIRTKYYQEYASCPAGQ